MHRCTVHHGKVNKCGLEKKKKKVKNVNAVSVQSKLHLKVKYDVKFTTPYENYHFTDIFGGVLLTKLSLTLIQLTRYVGLKGCLNTAYLLKTENLLLKTL